MLTGGQVHQWRPTGRFEWVLYEPVIWYNISVNQVQSLSVSPITSVRVNSCDTTTVTPGYKHNHILETAFCSTLSMRKQKVLYWKVFRNLLSTLTHEWDGQIIRNTFQYNQVQITRTIKIHQQHEGVVVLYCIRSTWLATVVFHQERRVDEVNILYSDRSWWWFSVSTEKRWPGLDRRFEAADWWSHWHR